MSSSLPDFSRPPLQEVALSVQFEPLDRLLAPHLGLLWQKYRDEFPKTEEHPPLQSVVERFDEPELRKLVHVRLVSPVQYSRVWYVSDDETRLIQAQQDRFAQNWRKPAEGDAPYPRYPALRAAFSKSLGTFHEFLAENSLGSISPNQCEVSYVNAVDLSDIEADPLTVFQERYSDSFLTQPEGFSVKLGYIIEVEGRKRGRLRVTAVSPSKTHRQLQLTLTARGEPLGSSIEDILQFFDLGREWIVRGFTSITSERLHEAWGRIR